MPEYHQSRQSRDRDACWSVSSAIPLMALHAELFLDHDKAWQTLGDLSQFEPEFCWTSHHISWDRCLEGQIYDEQCEEPSLSSQQHELTVFGEWTGPLSALFSLCAKCRSRRKSSRVPTGKCSTGLTVTPPNGINICIIVCISVTIYSRNHVRGETISYNKYRMRCTSCTRGNIPWVPVDTSWVLRALKVSTRHLADVTSHTQCASHSVYLLENFYKQILSTSSSYYPPRVWCVRLHPLW